MHESNEYATVMSTRCVNGTIMHKDIINLVSVKSIIYIYMHENTSNWCLQHTTHEKLCHKGHVMYIDQSVYECKSISQCLKHLY